MSNKMFSDHAEMQKLHESLRSFMRKALGGGRGMYSTSPDKQQSTPVDAEEVPDEEAPPSIKMPPPPTQSNRPTRDLKVDVGKTNIQDLAMQILGLPEKPNPNKNKAANRALQTLTAKIATKIRDALKDLDPSIGKVSIYENQNLEKIILEELNRVLNEEK